MIYHLKGHIYTQSDSQRDNQIKIEVLEILQNNTSSYLLS